MPLCKETSGQVWENIGESLVKEWSKPVKDPFDFLGRVCLTGLIGAAGTALAAVDQFEREPERTLATVAATAVGAVTGGVGGVLLGGATLGAGHVTCEYIEHERDKADSLERYNNAHKQEAERRSKCTNNSDADAFFS